MYYLFWSFLFHLSNYENYFIAILKLVIEQLPRRKHPPPPPENCPCIRKFPTRTIVATQAIHIFFTDFNQTLQNNTYKRTPFTKCLLNLLRQNARKYNSLEKLTRKKIRKNFMVNNNNKIICIWYLSSKWPVRRIEQNEIVYIAQNKYL